MKRKGERLRVKAMLKMYDGIDDNLDKNIKLDDLMFDNKKPKKGFENSANEVDNKELTEN